MKFTSSLVYMMAAFVVASTMAASVSSSSYPLKEQQLTAAAASLAATPTGGNGYPQTSHVATHQRQRPDPNDPLTKYKMPFIGGRRRVISYDDLNDDFEGGDRIMAQAGASAEEQRHGGGVYDPGDDLLRALTAELNAAAGNADEGDYTDLDGEHKYEVLSKLQRDLQEDQEIISKTAVLMKLLEDPSIETLPVVYVEEAATMDATPNDTTDSDSSDSLMDNNEAEEGLYGSRRGIAKRGRYYRRYTWKRHNRNRSSSYEPELRYACTPSKEDILKLLLNLHENRKGNPSKTVHICNRKRPAKAVFTNIRFLG